MYQGKLLMDRFSFRHIVSWKWKWHRDEADELKKQMAWAQELINTAVCLLTSEMDHQLRDRKKQAENRTPPRAPPIFIFYKTRFDVSSSLVCLSCLLPKLHSCTQTRCLLAIQESRPTSMHTHEGHRPSHTCTGHRLPLEDITRRSALFYGLFLWLVCLKHACSIHQTQLPLGRPKRRRKKKTEKESWIQKARC